MAGLGMTFEGTHEDLGPIEGGRGHELGERSLRFAYPLADTIILSLV